MFNGCRVSVWKEGKVLAVDGGDGCTGVGCTSCQRTEHLKIAITVNFTCILSHTHKSKPSGFELVSVLIHLNRCTELRGEPQIET